MPCPLVRIAPPTNTERYVYLEETAQRDCLTDENSRTEHIELLYYLLAIIGIRQ